MTMRFLGLLVALLVAAVSPGEGLAGTYPDRPVRLVVPYPAGGGTDALARLVAHKLGEQWARSVVVDNRPGADTQIGNSAVATAAPDGYTLLIIATTFAMHKHMVPSLPYEPATDFVPIASIAVYPYFLVVGNDLPVKTAKDLIALARSNPGKLNFGISSGGQYILAETMKRGAGIDVIGVRYKGGTPAVQATVTGEITYHLDTPGSFKAMIDAGKLRVLATTGDRRSPLAPDAPTFAEVGLAGGDIVSWVGLAAPKGTPAEIVEFVNASVQQALSAPDVKQKLDSLMATPMQQNVADFTAFVNKEFVRYEKVIKEQNIKY
jgi:tripartite-type tricarboxylate transporter receptor subunit TctC